MGRPYVAVDGITVPLSARQLAVVVRLALGGHRPTPPTRLLSAWPDGTASNGALRVTLTRLRPLLAPAQLVRVDGGYLLSPVPELDCERFEQLLRASRAPTAEPATRVAQLDAALALWTGPAYDGMDDLEWAHHEAARLEELRELALDLRYELLLGLPAEAGSPTAIEHALADLNADFDRTPDREHRAALLAAALYRCGRQADALAVLAKLRAYLREELGLEPGRPIDELELRILNHDPALATVNTAARAPHPEIERQLTAARNLLRAGAAAAAEPIGVAALGAARSHGNRAQLASALLLNADIAVATGNRPIEPLIEEAHALARVVGDAELRAQAALARFGRGVPLDWHRMLVDLTEPLSGLVPDSRLRLELLGAAAALLSFTAPGTATEQLLHAAEETHRAIGTAYSEAIALAVRAIVAPRPAAAIDDARRSVDVALETGDPRLTVVAIHAVLKVGWTCAALDAIEGVLGPLEEHSRRAGIAFGRVRVQIATGALAIARGDFVTAGRAIDATRAVGEQLGGHAAGPAARWQEIQLALERGQAAAVLPSLRALPIGGLFGIGPLAVAAAFGDADDLERLRSMYRQVRRGDTYGLQVALVARAAVAHADVELGEWCAPILSQLGDYVITHGFGSVVLGPAPLFLGLASAATGKWVDALESFRRAAAIADRAGAALWLAEARAWMARAHAELGEAEQAVRVLIGTPIQTPWLRVREIAASAEALLGTGVPTRR